MGKKPKQQSSSLSKDQVNEIKTQFKGLINNYNRLSRQQNRLLTQQQQEIATQGQEQARMISDQTALQAEYQAAQQQAQTEQEQRQMAGTLDSMRQQRVIQAYNDRAQSQATSSARKQLVTAAEQRSGVIAGLARRRRYGANY